VSVRVGKRLRSAIARRACRTAAYAGGWGAPLVGAMLATLAGLCACNNPPRSLPLELSGPTAQWPEWGGDKGGLRYAPLTQITRENVARLDVAWVYRHGDVSDGSGEYKRTSFQATPIVVDDRLYFCTAFNRVIALEAETGRESWVFDPQLTAKTGSGPYPLTCRGVAYWRGPGSGECATRIFTGTRDAQLIALDAATGRPCSGFGRSGRVDLREGVGDHEPWEYYPTSAPIVVRDVVVIGALVADNVRVDAPSGVVRAFDARTGRLRWAWDPLPPDRRDRARSDGARYASGTPNVWAPLSADDDRGLVFVPTGNPSPDLYGGQRDGIDFFGSSTVALDATNGSVRWHFQTVHHDVWDYDVPAQPVLFQHVGVGGGRAALAQATKMGHVFLLDRETGRPLYPVEERPVPQGGVAGERLSPTQPFPTHPPPLHPARLTADEAFGFTPFDRADCKDRIDALRNDGLFTPPSLRGSLQYPGSAGGPNWGSIAIDPERGWMFVNQMHSAAVVQLIPRQQFDALDADAAHYPEELYPMRGTPYGVRRSPLLSSWGAPCNPPPWGTLTAVDLASGRVLWRSTLGTTRDQAPWPMWLALGAPNLGGSVVTAGGLLFIGATTDKFLRAFDTATGEEVWRRRLPYTANANPISYRLRPDSKQFVVIAAGGHGWSQPGDTLIAFALRD
jgi:quinoprotein glucose dehydrogenase